MVGLDELVTGLCSTIFDPLPRSDQHKWGNLYVRGLLAVEGRKTMRSIASLSGKRTVEQNLHHFISNSSWDWQPVRELLAQHVDEVIDPKAWVVNEMVIPKRGPHTVGVERTFVPQLGRIVNNQRAFGVWLADEYDSCPVNWRLVLPSEWAASPDKRHRADIPESLEAEGPDLCALNAALEMIDNWNIDRRPLIMDARDGDVPRLVAEFTRRDIQFLIRIGGPVEVVAADPNGPQASSLRSARYIGDCLIKLRQPTEWRDSQCAVRRLSLAATAPVSMLTAANTGWTPRRRVVELVLLAEWRGRGPEPATLWLTNVNRSAGSLLRLSKLPRRVAKDFSEVCTRVGIQDFEGRSFNGWHRHATLASIAHAVLVTARIAYRARIPRARADNDDGLASSGVRGRL